MHGAMSNTVERDEKSKLIKDCHWSGGPSIMRVRLEMHRHVDCRIMTSYLVPCTSVIGSHELL